MRAVVQRVLSASVSLADPPTLVSSIGPGICVLVGISRSDTLEDVKWMCNKLLSIRLWSDGDRTWAKSVRDTEGEVLLVSQFTLMHVLKGNKPDFHNAMGPDAAGDLFSRLVELAAAQYQPARVKSGAFRQYMKVAIENDGPVTLVVDSPDRTPPAPRSPSTPKEDATEDGRP
eukprot:GGOE01043152.1.p2 GENE.GGOE01043152.1~~GGOE01043152.1.p2  ORF type:complete len:173 (-),score=44.02 GGOE01043152.1:353-871(-)